MKYGHQTDLPQLCGILKDNLNNNKRVNMGVLKYKVVQI
jgi:hypothetical protein